MPVAAPGMADELIEGTVRGSSTTWWRYKSYVDMAQALERAWLDYIMIEDTLSGSKAYGDSAAA